MLVGMDQRIDLITLRVEDLDAATRFYADGLGWTTMLHVPGEVTFLQSAGARKHLAKAWPVAGPGIRGDQSSKSWLKGDIAVVPYPGESMDKAPIKVDWSYPTSVGLSVALLPRKGTGEKPQVFNMELKKAGKRWVVDSWVPYAPPAVPADLNQ